MLRLSADSPPHIARIRGAAATETLTFFRSPTMADGLTYALFPNLLGHTKPAGYPSLAALARRIHRDRKGDALQLRAATVKFRDHDRAVVEVIADDQAGGRSRLIGFAWMARGSQAALQEALRKAQTADVYGGWDA